MCDRFGQLITDQPRTLQKLASAGGCRDGKTSRHRQQRSARPFGPELGPMAADLIAFDLIAFEPAGYTVAPAQRDPLRDACEMLQGETPGRIRALPSSSICHE
jgi:hypothetical protein